MTESRKEQAQPVSAPALGPCRLFLNLAIVTNRVMPAVAREDPPARTQSRPAPAAAQTQPPAPQLTASNH